MKIIEQSIRRVVGYIKHIFLFKIVLRYRSDLFFAGNKECIPVKNIIKDDIWEEFQKQCTYKKLLKEENPLIHTNKVAFELSNLCNYAFMHRKCPLNLEVGGEHIILSAKIVFSVLDTLAKYNYKGEITFHNYNEPLIDPRLFKFIEYAHNICPDSKIHIYTNGYYLDQNLADELVNSGVSSIFVSGYSKKEIDRLSKIKMDIPYTVAAERLFDIFKDYNENPRINLNVNNPCFAPLRAITIGRDGKILLCCKDWKRIYTFGNLYEQSFEEILRKGKMQAVYQRLSRGDRFLNLCQRCNSTR